ncbi:carbohydrate kinase family protein [Patescibacteria group bacterium]|nr:carbohydrate kinase family protein [Patescibacteria group bacterium]MBU4056597.1 carbohydrate kinase family protein [Patescibacteria group bacterium]MBU4369008.1 carbohydrate kinase family protein [Patescibacteria group bacterium]
MKYDIITIGGATYDITFFPAENEGILIDNKQDILRQKLLAFEHGAKINSEKVVYGFGGGAANTAVSFSRLGFKTAAIVAIGKDIFGNEIIANLKKQKVDAELTQKIPNQSSDLAVIIIGPDKDRVIFFDNKIKNKLQLSRKSIAAIKKTKWIYLASLSGNWQKILTEVFDVKNKKPEIKIAWNPGQSQLIGGITKLKEFLKQTEVLILNQDEAIQLAMSDSEIKEKNIYGERLVVSKIEPSRTIDLNNVKNLLLRIKSYGSQIAVITCGKDGAWAYDGKEVHFAKIQKEQKRIDTTGVGDAFGSSFVAGMELFSGDIDKAMKLGILNTASVVAAPGAQNGLLSKKDLSKLKINNLKN